MLFFYYSLKLDIPDELIRDSFIVGANKNIFLGLGSNMGDREKNLLLAIKKINESAGTVAMVSSLYRTAPWGKQDQPEFLNQVIVIESPLFPIPLLRQLQMIENELGREREEVWGPRTLDIDILFYNDEIIQRPGIIIPHPEIANRRFVLMPLCEIAPDLIHPLLGKKCCELLEECTDELTVETYAPES